jgi:hypothetical protein
LFSHFALLKSLLLCPWASKGDALFTGKYTFNERYTIIAMAVREHVFEWFCGRTILPKCVEKG